MDRKRGIIIIILVILGVVSAVSAYFSFVEPETCNNYYCFQENMIACEKAVHVSDQTEASWRYEVKGTSGGECEVEVELLQAREGELNLQELEGLSMNCYYELGEGTYPEEDLNKCHGRLKEGIQNIIIERLHSILIENFDKFDEQIDTITSID